MKIRIGDAFDLQMGKTPSRNVSTYWNGTNKWISISDMGKEGKYIAHTKECITDTGVLESGIKVVPRNTVIMSFKLSIGKVAITSEDIYTNEAIIAFIDKGICPIDKDYLYYLLLGTNWQAGSNKAVKGLTLNKETLSNRCLNIPDIDRQKYIVKVLDKVFELIYYYNRQLEKLEELVKSRFIEMFGDCIGNPKKWPIKVLGEVAEVGSSKRVFVEELKASGVPFFRGTEIGALAEGKAIIPELFISEDHFNALCKETGRPDMGDLLMPSICPDGRIWLVNTNKPFYFKDGRVLWIYKVRESFNPVFLLYTLKDRIISDYSSIASGTTFAELKIFALKKCKVFNVPIDLQNEFANFVSQADKSKFAIQKSLEKLETLKKSLMQQYFS